MNQLPNKETISSTAEGFESVRAGIESIKISIQTGDDGPSSNEVDMTDAKLNLDRLLGNISTALTNLESHVTYEINEIKDGFTEDIVKIDKVLDEMIEKVTRLLNKTFPEENGVTEAEPPRDVRAGAEGIPRNTNGMDNNTSPEQHVEYFFAGYGSSAKGESHRQF